MNINFYTLLSQIIFATWFFIIHFITIPPLNDIDKFPNTPSWKQKLFITWCMLIVLIVGYTFGNFYFKLPLVLLLGLFMIGHINTWWLPYFFGWPKVFTENIEIDHKCTLRFLPSRKNHPVPDVAYCILGLAGLMALILSIKSLFLL